MDLFSATPPSRSSALTRLLLLLAAYFFLLPGISQAQTLVTTTSDSGPGSLRAAITNANANPGADTITFSNGTGGTVNFTDATPETIDLASALPDLSTDITISGPGADKLTIRRPSAAATQFRIFYVSSVAATVNLSGLTLTGGNSGSDSGGGIRNSGTLTVTACAITGNTAGSRPGGGIFSDRRLTVHSSAISGNTASTGGGVHSRSSSPPFTAASTVNILVNTTLSGNNAGDYGGGFYNPNGLSYLVNCTLTGNSAPANQGGGVTTYGDSSTETRFANTLCVGNTGGDVNYISTTNSNISLGGNLIGTGNSGANFSGETTAVAASAILGPLANNGGPTPTHALLSGSPALNTGITSNARHPTDAIFNDANDVVLATDQRGSGFLRAIGTVDVGAFESQPVAVVPTQVTNTSASGPGSLQEAIIYANTNPGADTITFSDGLGGTTNFFDAAPETIDLTPLPDLSTDITISGPGADKLTIRRPAAAATEFRIFFVRSTATVNLSGLTLTGGNGGSVGGGCIFNSGTLTVTACAITGNTSGSGFGGGIFSEGKLTVHSSTISGNTASNGGGVSSRTSSPPFTATSTVTILVNTTLSANTATASGSGGGFRNGNGLSYLVNCTLTGNSAPANQGGGVATYGDSATVTRFANTLCVGNFGGDVNYVTGATNSNVSLGGNLIGTGNSGANFSGQTNTTPAYIILGALADNGGPTWTHALLPGSPALNTGVTVNAKNPSDAIFGDANDVTLATDQRGNGFLRVALGAVDVGAFEQQTSLTPPTLVTTTSDGGPGSLRAAIAFANANAGADTITFSDGTGGTVNFNDATPETIDLLTGLPSLSTDITISGPGANKLTLRRLAGAATQFPIFTVFIGATVNLSGLTLTGGNGGATRGGGISNSGTLSVTACAITGNTAGSSLYGGGIYSEGKLTVHSSTISGNTADYGGGVSSSTSSPPFTAASNVTILVNTTLSGNTALRGGGFSNGNGLSYLVNCTLTGNNAPANEGGGVATYGGSATVTRFANTLCVGNTGGGDVDYVGATNSNTSLGGNLIGTGNSGANFPGQTTAAAASTILDPIPANNGGPTRTHALLPGSPALNAGLNAKAKNPTDAIFDDANDVALTTDQRGSGFLRAFGTVDIGAFEAQTAVLGNQMPSFTKGANQALPATAAPQFILAWATAISDGDAAATQALSFTVTAVSGANLLSVGPAIDPATGNLTFTPSGNAGTATFNVTLTDDASINGTPALTTAVQTFNLTFTAVAAGVGTAAYNAAAAFAALPPNQRGPNDIPANDGVSNLIKYALGLGPMDSATGHLPTPSTGAANEFPTIRFVRKKGLSPGIAVKVEIASSLTFADKIAGMITAIEDLGGGNERVTFRSSIPFTGSTTTAQFFRVIVEAN